MSKINKEAASDDKISGRGNPRQVQSGLMSIIVNPIQNYY